MIEQGHATHPVDDRHQRRNASAHRVCHRGAADLDALPYEDLRLTIKRKVIAELVDEDIGDQGFGRQAAGHNVRRGRGLGHSIAAAAAGIARPDRHHHAMLRRDDVELFGTILTDLVQRAAPPQAHSRLSGSITTSKRGRCAGSDARSASAGRRRGLRPQCPASSSVLSCRPWTSPKGDGLVFQRQCELICGKLLRTLAECRAVDQLENMLFMTSQPMDLPTSGSGSTYGGRQACLSDHEESFSDGCHQNRCESHSARPDGAGKILR